MQKDNRGGTPSDDLAAGTSSLSLATIADEDGVAGNQNLGSPRPSQQPETDTMDSRYVAAATDLFIVLANTRNADILERIRGIKEKLQHTVEAVEQMKSNGPTEDHDLGREGPMQRRLFMLEAFVEAFSLEQKVLTKQMESKIRELKVKLAAKDELIAHIRRESHDGHRENAEIADMVERCNGERRALTARFDSLCERLNGCEEQKGHADGEEGSWIVSGSLD